MAASGSKFYYVLLLVLLVIEGGLAKKCSISDISIKQIRTSKHIEGHIEFETVISNNCACPQSKLIIQCFGLSSVEELDPLMVKRLENGDCLINNGKPIIQGHPFKFRFAWLTPFDLKPKTSHVECRKSDGFEAARKHLV